MLREIPRAGQRNGIRRFRGSRLHLQARSCLTQRRTGMSRFSLVSHGAGWPVGLEGLVSASIRQRCDSQLAEEHRAP